MNPRVFHDADVLTLDPARPRAQAVLVEDGRISRVGTDREVLRAAPPGAENIPLQGGTVVPGFNDNHLHLRSLGEGAGTLKLHGLDAHQIVEALRTRFAACAPGEILTADGWDYHSCPHPHRFLLDAVFPDNPVLLWQFGGHALWVNTCALRSMRIAPGGRGGTSDQAGVVADYVENPYIRRLYRRRLKDTGLLREQLQHALQELRKAGITTAQDNTWHPVVVRVLRMLHGEDRLSCRISCWSRGASPAQVRRMRRQPYEPEWFHPGPCKYFADGTFSGRSAWLSSPYSDDAERCGGGRSARDMFTKMRPQVSRRRQIACHAIGDRAVGEFLDTVEQLQRRYPWTRELRLRLEHAQLVRPEDMERIRELGVIVAAQPSALSSPQKDLAILGPERAERAYPYRSLLEAGVPLSFGSDAPSETTLEPIACMHLAVNRPGPEAISPRQALECYTRGSAFAELRESEKGAILPGMLADFVVLSRNPLAVAPESIKDIRVTMTVVGGKTVFEHAGGTP